jgi:hypothetical protein
MSHISKVFFHFGPELGIETRVSRGEAWIDSSGLNVRAISEISLVPGGDVQNVEMFRLHGTARVIRVDYKGGRLYLAVIRFMIGQFASVNFFKTGDLYKALANPPKT